MPDWTKSTDKTETIDILLFDGFSNLCLANTVEPLRAANMISAKALYKWRIFTLSGAPAVSSSGLNVTPDAALEQNSGALLAVMPSYGFREMAGWRTQTALRAAAGRYPVMAGLDTGAWLMATAGLLDGYRATIHWEELTGFEERFSDIKVLRERYVVDRDRFTCSGARAAYDLIHYLIGETHGQALALEVGQLLMARDRNERGEPTPADQAISLMAAHLEQPLPIGEIARECGQTQKALEQRMQATYGASPRTIYRRLRLNHARKLSQESSLSVREIALRCGYDDPSAFTRAFRAEFGTTPRAMRVPGKA
ncbi:MAG: GlxA family transcriptional regulator [Cognatishimia sp.]|uniref:GlxA family transcriptional regulator n=1 Tax=Cognatishimia sp. TaxID=2211648 RepID=UPI00405884BE